MGFDRSGEVLSLLKAILLDNPTLIWSFLSIKITNKIANERIGEKIENRPKNSLQSKRLHLSETLTNIFFGSFINQLRNSPWFPELYKAF